MFHRALPSLLPVRRCCNKASEAYTQGQSPAPGIREYFYYVDHHGMLFQDDSKMKHWTAALKEKKLLFNFFRRLRFNETGRYEREFKYLSLCGRERNFVRCDDRPTVFHTGIRTVNLGSLLVLYLITLIKLTILINPPLVEKDKNGDWVLHHNHAGDLLAQV